VFLKLGLTGFGGPAAHIALMEQEVVRRRGWLQQQEFLDLIGAVNLIPGPNSTELAMYLGYTRAGIGGLIVAGIGFILPAVLITGLFAWGYMTYGTLPALRPIWGGIMPVIWAIIVFALLRLLNTALKNWFLTVLALGVGVGSLLGFNELVLLLGSGLLAAGVFRSPGVYLLALTQEVRAESVAPTATLGALGLFFLKVGSVLFGSGYVLVAFLEGLVRDYGWLTRQQLLDAVAVGQFTPGPVLSTATFVGYVIAGPAGALVATGAIFLPSFLLVGLLTKLLPRLSSPRIRCFLDGVNAGSVALMGAVVLKLIPTSFTSGWAVGIGLVSLGLLARTRLNPTWLIGAGGLVGWLVGGMLTPL